MRKVDRDLTFVFQTVLFDYPCHTDNRHGFLGVKPEALSDRIFMRPETLGELIIDYATNGLSTLSWAEKNRPFNKGICMARK